MERLFCQAIALLLITGCIESVKSSQKSDCDSEHLYNSLTSVELDELRLTLTMKTGYPSETQNHRENFSELNSFDNILQAYLNMSCHTKTIEERGKNESISNNVWIYRGEDQNRLHMIDCRNNFDRCHETIIDGFIDDFILTPNGSRIFYRRGRNVYLSETQNLDIHIETAPLFCTSTTNARFIYASANEYDSVIFEECVESSNRVLLNDGTTQESVCIFEVTPRKRSKRGALMEPVEKEKNPEEDRAARWNKIASPLIIGISIPFGCAVFAVIAFLLYFCFWHKPPPDPDQMTNDETIPQSMIERARKAEPTASQKDQNLPQNYIAEQFTFKGPLLVPHRPQLTRVHKLDCESNKEVKPGDHLEFDPSLNEAFEIGEGVEKAMSGKRINYSPSDRQRPPEIGFEEVPLVFDPPPVGKQPHSSESAEKPTTETNQNEIHQQLSAKTQSTKTSTDTLAKAAEKRGSQQKSVSKEK